MNYLLRNMPPELHKALKIKAAQEEKTLQQVIIEALEKSLE